MTIAKGCEWGLVARVPHDVVVAGDESCLAQAVIKHLHDISRRPLAVVLSRGNLLTAVGSAVGTRIPAPREGESCRMLPCDAYEVTIEHGAQTTTTLAVSSVMVGSARRPVWWMTSGGFLGRLNVSPNSHPNDGFAEALEWSTSDLRTVMAIRRRMRLGDHLPHPDLAMSRGSTLRWRAHSTPRRVRVDGRTYGRAVAVSVTVRPDAFSLVVCAG